MNEKRDNSGIIFKNLEKESANHPDMKGFVTIEGKDYWVSGWKKDGQKGPFVSLAFKPKEARPEPRRPAERARVEPKEDEDLPW